MVDWSDPASRARHIEQVGPAQYEADQAAHVEAYVVAVENGHGIRPIDTRFGRLMQVMGGEMTAFRTLDEAKRHAKGLPPGTRTARKDNDRPKSAL